MGNVHDCKGNKLSVGDRCEIPKTKGINEHIHG